MRIHHIGIACKDLSLEIQKIQQIHDVESISNIVFDKNQNANLCLIKINNGISIELISGKQVENLIKKKISYYHLCYEVDDIEGEIKRLSNAGGILMSHPKPAILFENRKVAFLMLSYGIIELLEI